MSREKGLTGRGQRCPDCGSEALRRSQMRGLLERGLLRVIGVRAFRCESCDKRHYALLLREVLTEKKGPSA
jgi:hypothetical protein